MAAVSGFWAVLITCNVGLSVALVAMICASPLDHALNPWQASVAIAYFVAILTWVQAEAVQQLGISPAFTRLQLSEMASALGSSDEEDGDDKSEGDAPTGCVPAISDSYLGFLRAAAEMGVIMIVMYICDRTSLVGKGPKHASKPEFWGVFLLLVLLSFFGLRKSHDSKVSTVADVKPLQREQTEEWKGWMQVMFLLYHYWMAAEMYNAIRMFIAAYIWMTGFGNFSYYYTKEDFGMPRFVQVPPPNATFLMGKIFGMLLLSTLIWDVPGVFDTLSAPLTPLLRYSGDLYQGNRAALYEWHFRSYLDHFVWIFGMLIAYGFPKFDAWLNKLDIDEERQTIRWAAIAAVSSVFAAWFVLIGCKGKFEYNALHPYTSFIPIGCYIFLRNSTRWLREHVLPAWCEIGKYTLETYICQFHIWMRTTGENGNPKSLLVFLPGWFWLNFVVVSAFYVFLSIRLFKITLALKDICVPNDVRAIVINVSKIGSGAVGFAALGLATHRAFALPNNASA
ncbi:10 TM acyl transferase domain found in Cas1p-domain-containing protein [Pavlovales sp. CCMP2436]|nr:10 TM acyl transferase domain found in Cas1p-domain-containing protein [Pavlovales sp. CCMP2436]